MPLIQLHSLTSLSPPLISHDKISVSRYRYFIVTASPRGKPRGSRLTILPFTEPLYPGNGRAATSRPYRCGGSRGWRQEQGYVPSTPLRKQRYCAALGDTSALLSFTNPLLLHLSQSTSTFCCKLPEKQPYFL